MKSCQKSEESHEREKMPDATALSFKSRAVFGPCDRWEQQIREEMFQDVLTAAEILWLNIYSCRYAPHWFIGCWCLLHVFFLLCLSTHTHTHTVFGLLKTAVFNGVALHSWLNTFKADWWDTLVLGKHLKCIMKPNWQSFFGFLV